MFVSTSHAKLTQWRFTQTTPHEKAKEEKSSIFMLINKGILSEWS